MARTTYAAAPVALAAAGVLLAGGCSGSGGAGPAGGSGGAGGAGWERLPDAPLSGRTDPVVVGVGDEVLVVGGWEFLCPPNADCVGPDTPPFRDGALLDPATGDWRSVADAPVGLVAAESAVLGDRVFVTTTCLPGPCDDGARLLRYDVSDDAWEDLGRTPDAAGPTVLGDRLLFAHTSDEQGEEPDHLYDPATGRWEELPDDPLPWVYDRFVVVDGDRFLVLGSPRSGPEEESGPKLAAAYDLRRGRWSRLPDAPGHGFQAWRSGHEVWLNPHFGTAGGGVLDLRTDLWRAFPAPPPGLVEDEPLDLAGVVGAGGATYEYASGWVRDTRDDRWLRVPDAARGDYGEALTAVGRDLVVFGGQRWEGSDGELLNEARVWRPPGQIAGPSTSR